MDRTGRFIRRLSAAAGLTFGFMLVCTIILSGCAGQREIPPNVPEWVRQGTGPAIADGTRYLYGVGVVGKMKSRVLMRAAADNKAKNKLGRAADDFVETLMAAYLKSPTAVISDHWQDPETGNYFALCRLELSRLLGRIALARMLPESLQRFTLKEGPLLFDRQSLTSDS